MPTPHLILLVGSNPVPNAIAALCMADSQTVISLFHSVESFEVAQRLTGWLRRHVGTEGDRLHLAALSHAGDEYRPSAIQAALTRHLVDPITRRWKNLGLPQVQGPPCVHLHYTGGTKAMTVHAYRTLEAIAVEHRLQFEASYLDPDKLALIVDPRGEVPEEIRPVPDHIQLRMTDLLELHGWQTLGEVGAKDPLLPELAMALLQDHAEHGPRPWDEWIIDELMPKTHRLITVRGQLVDTQDGVWHKFKMPDQSKYLRSTERLSSALLVWPDRSELSRFKRIFDGCELPQLSLGQTAANLGLGTAHTLCEWLKGKWMESAVLHVLLQQQQQLGLHEVLMSVEPDPPNGFEFDVVAIKGYRLFAFSCTTGEQRKGTLKQKFFEASIRARQMGGDEARTALVCCWDKPQEVQSELESEFDLKGKIKVFGRNDLKDLASALSHWIHHP